MMSIGYLMCGPYYFLAGWSFNQILTLQNLARVQTARAGTDP